MKRCTYLSTLLVVLLPALALAAPDDLRFPFLSLGRDGTVWRATQSEVYGPGKERYPSEGRLAALSGAKSRAWVAVEAQGFIRVRALDDAEGQAFAKVDGLAALSDDLALVHGQRVEQLRSFVYLVDRSGKAPSALRVTRRENQQGKSLLENLADTQVQLSPGRQGVWIASAGSAWSKPALYFIAADSKVATAHDPAYELTDTKALDSHPSGGACVHDGQTVYFTEATRGEAKLSSHALLRPRPDRLVAVRAAPWSPRTCLVLLRGPDEVDSVTVGAPPQLYAEGLPGATNLSALELNGKPTVLLQTQGGLRFSPTMRPARLADTAFGPAGVDCVVADEEGSLWCGSTTDGFTRVNVPRNWAFSVLPFFLVLWLLAIALGIMVIVCDEHWLNTQGWGALFGLAGVEAAVVFVARSQWSAELLRVDADTLAAMAAAVAAGTPLSLVVLLTVTRHGHDFLRAASGEKLYAILLLVLIRIPWFFRRMFDPPVRGDSAPTLPPQLGPFVEQARRDLVDVKVPAGEVGETARALYATMADAFKRGGHFFPVAIGLNEPTPTSADDFATALRKALGPLALDALVLKPLLLQRRVGVVIAAPDANDGIQALVSFVGKSRDKLAGCVVRAAH